MPKPTVFLGIGSGSHAEQTAKVMIAFEQTCQELKPDLVIVVGDVNSTIACALVAVKLGITTVHVEAGLRSYDRSMPEEINRIATDAICDYWFTTEESGNRILKESGYPADRIFFVGNTMIDSLHFALPRAEKSSIKEELGLTAGKYGLVTMHRPSNVDDPEQLKSLLEILTEISNERAIVFPMHPRTSSKIREYGFSSIIESGKQLIIT
ncbi:MAG: UDP-N-acetyl glucosamine 2-epimerase, partial [Candidatus Kapaibacteriota bacterium]